MKFFKRILVAILAAGILSTQVVSAQSDAPLSSLAPNPSPSTADLLYVVHSGASFSMTVGALAFNYVDKSTTQTIAGQKTFSSGVNTSSGNGFEINGVSTVFSDGTNTELKPVASGGNVYFNNFLNTINNAHFLDAGGLVLDRGGLTVVSNGIIGNAAAALNRLRFGTSGQQTVLSLFNGAGFSQIDDAGGSISGCTGSLFSFSDGTTGAMTLGTTCAGFAGSVTAPLLTSTSSTPISSGVSGTASSGGLNFGNGSGLTYFQSGNSGVAINGVGSQFLLCTVPGILNFCTADNSGNWGFVGTLNASEHLAFTVSGLAFGDTSGTTSDLYTQLQNTGNTSYFGIESSTGGSLLTGSSPYATIAGTSSARPFDIGTSNITRLEVGTSGAFNFEGNLIANAVIEYTLTKFSSSGTFTTPVDSTTHTIYHYRIVGGGGGGGGTNGAGAAGGGGGAGGYAEGTFTGQTASTAITVTVGAGGAGGVNTGGTGTAGGTSSISATTVTCSGGGGGVGSTSATVGIGTAASGGNGGGVGGTPVIAQPGGQGSYGQGIIASSIWEWGKGGTSVFGGGALLNGSPGVAFGNGGNGGAGTSNTGGAGASGIVIIERMTP